MCNAQNHHPGCDCGFGPKDGMVRDPIPRSRGGGFQGRIYRGKRKSFGEQALENIEVLRNALRESGEDKKYIASTLKEYKKQKFPLSERKVEHLDWEEKKQFINAIKRMIGIRRFKIEKTKTKTVKVPLFTFGAPPVKRSTVIYEETTDFTKKTGWIVSLLIPGIGMGASQEFKTKISCTYSCHEGMFKTIFIPVRLRISKLGIYEKGIRIGDGGLRITAEGGKAERNYKRGVRICNPKKCKEFSDTLIDEFLFADDDKHDIERATHLLGTRYPKDVSIGFKVHGIEAAVKVEISLEKEIKLEYNLPGGHDYFLYGLGRQLGIGWKVSNPKGKQKIKRGRQHGHRTRAHRKAGTDQLYSRTIPLY